MTHGKRLSLAQLNPRQKEAVLHGDGPLLVLAGAGSGKTSTMAYRIASLIADRHVPASKILGLSFTKKAAEELRERVKKLVQANSGKSAVRGLTISTFHSLCARILREEAERIGYQKTFTIQDTHDQIDLIRGILKTIRLDERKFDPDRILFEIGQAKNRFLKPEEAEEFFLGPRKLPHDYALVLTSVYPRYQAALKTLNALDFDDLIFQTVHLLESHADVREKYNLKFRYLLVDEYQDTNPAQFRLLELLTEKSQNICVVGDDDQSIYAWRGADSRHILEFSRHFPAAKLVTLDQNYRSTSTILDVANEVISKNQHRHPKRLWSDKGAGEPIQMIITEEDRSESEWVGDQILESAKSHPFKDFAILYRSNAQSRLFEEALRMRKIPYKIVGGMSFLDRKEVKDVLSYWRIILNPKDDASARRVINWPARGIGKSTIEAANEFAVKHGHSFLAALEAPGLQATLPAKSLHAVQAFLNLLRHLKSTLDATPPNAQSLSNWARSTIERLGIKRALEEETEDPVQFNRKWENVDELCHSLGQVELEEVPAELDAKAFLSDWLSRMMLEAMDQEEERKDRKEGEQRDAVTLLTLHGAKGLEYPVVFMVGMEEGLLPHKRTIEEATDFSEERRLCYVGITRAKEHLFLTRAVNRIRYGKPVPRIPSRFIDEIPRNLLIVRNESKTPDLSTKELQEEHEVKVKDFLSKIRSQLSTNPKGVNR